MDTVLPMHKPSSQNSEKVHMNRYLIPFFGNHNLRDITPALVQQFISAQSCSPKTVRNIYATFRSAWKTARAWGYVAHGVSANEGVVLPRLRPVERPSFTLDQMQAIIREAEEPFKTFFWLAAETGMRAGELCGIRWTDIDENAGRVQVRQSVWRGTVGSPKSVAGSRTIPISTQLCEHLASRRAVQSGLLFVTHNGQPWDTRFIVRDRLRPILNRLGLPPAGLHAFRHGNASYRLQQGEDVKTLATRLGHSDPSVTLKVYAHAAHKGGQDLSNTMGGILDPNVPRISPQVVENTEVCT
jgi:integrase